MRRIDLSRQAAKFLKGLPPKHGRQIATKLAELCFDPRPHDSKELQSGASAYRRTDVGEYRVIYSVTEQLIMVALIGKRNDDAVYRMFRRMT